MAPRRLRIAFVTDVFDGAKAGGVVSARRFVAALRERHEVTVLASGAPGPGKIAVPAFTVPLFGRVMREMDFPFGLPRRAALRAALRDADLVHVQFPFWLGIRAAALARRLGKPVVAGFHVQPENMLLNVGVRSPALVEATYRLFLRGLYRRAQVVVCPTPFAAQQLLGRGLRVPVEVVSNGVALDLPDGPARRRREDGTFLILAVGRLAREKRLDVLLEGVRRSRHAARLRLVVTGRGPEEARVRKLAAALPRPAELGFLPDETLRRLYAEADLLLHASEVELEGIAVLEALARGTPALVADAPGSAARALAVGSGFLFRAGDPDDLARRLDALLDDPAALAAARAPAAEVAAAHDFDASVRRLEAVYARVADRSFIPGGGPAGASRAPPAGP